MSNYVYTALDMRGRAEITRLMFAAAGVKVNKKNNKMCSK